MICAYEVCKKEFEPKTHNQKYCSDECCRIATNEKLKEKYYERKARRAGVVFTCREKGCNQPLSKYNSEYICNPCKAKQKKKERQDLINMVRNVSR